MTLYPEDLKIADGRLGFSVYIEDNGKVIADFVSRRECEAFIEGVRWAADEVDR